MTLLKHYGSSFTRSTRTTPSFRGSGVKAVQIANRYIAFQPLCPFSPCGRRTRSLNPRNPQVYACSSSRKPSMRCPACSFENASGTKFCGECGAPLKLKCCRLRARKQ